METYRSGRSQGAQRLVTPTWNKLITKIMETYRSGRLTRRTASRHSHSGPTNINKWKRIEVVVTSRTRNAVDRKVTWVRISPFPPENAVRRNGVFICNGDIPRVILTRGTQCVRTQEWRSANSKQSAALLRQGFGYESHRFRQRTPFKRTAF